MKRFRIALSCFLLCLMVVFSVASKADARTPRSLWGNWGLSDTGNTYTTNNTNKTYDLVLVHGLLNMYAWSDEFLDACLTEYGSGNVYAIYLDGTTPVTTRTINGKTLYVAGGDNDDAGTDFLETQAWYMEDLINILQRDYGLSSSFSIIAHSMGGLVVRAYAVENPGKVADIVCLGTPNNGGLLFVSDWDSWMMVIMGAEEAASNVDPDYIQNYFNVEYPASAIDFVDDGHLYTIRGRTNIGTCGVMPLICELRLGYVELLMMGHPNNDGLAHAETVPIDGGIHLRDFWNCSHLDLVQDTDVADEALSVLR